MESHSFSPAGWSIRSKLPQLELAIGQKADQAKLKEAIPTIESLATPHRKMVMSPAEKANVKLGATPRDLIEILKMAQRKTHRFQPVPGGGIVRPGAAGRGVYPV